MHIEVIAVLSISFRGHWFNGKHYELRNQMDWIAALYWLCDMLHDKQILAVLRIA